LAVKKILATFVLFNKEYELRFNLAMPLLLGIDLLKFQVSSYSNLDTIDVGVYIVTTKNFQKVMKNEFNQNWEGSLNFEKVIKHLRKQQSELN